MLRPVRRKAARNVKKLNGPVTLPREDVEKFYVTAQAQPRKKP